MRLIKIFSIPALFASLLGAQALKAAEFEVLDKFSVDGYSVLRGSADIPGGSFAVGGSTFVVKAGNVGIGTVNPSAKIDIRNLSAAGIYAYFGASSDGGARGLQFTSGDNGEYLGAIHKLDATSAYGIIDLATGGAARLRIDSTGNVGIGTTTPQALLAIGAGSVASSNPTYSGSMLIASQMFSLLQAGGIEFRSVNWASGYGHRISSPDLGSGNTPLVFERRTNNVNWAESLRIDSAGNVGIGTAAPAATAKLHVAGDIIGSAQVFRAYLTVSFSKGASWEKLPFNATAYNTLKGTFDTGLNRFTASRAGYYQVSITGFSSTAGSGSERYGFSVAKNGTPETIAGGNYSAADTPLGGLTMILYLNGSTDYVEIQMYSAISAILNGGAGQYGMAWFMSYLGS